MLDGAKLSGKSFSLQFFPSEQVNPIPLENTLCFPHLSFFQLCFLVCLFVCFSSLSANVSILLHKGKQKN